VGFAGFLVREPVNFDCFACRPDCCHHSLLWPFPNALPLGLRHAKVQEGCFLILDVAELVWFQVGCMHVGVDFVS
jgi:hypothetical protein